MTDQADAIAVSAQGLAKSYGDVHALRGVDFDVPRGTVLGLLGPNGAGKTTAVRVLTTLTEPTQGRALVGGRDVVRESAAVRRQIGLAGQSAALIEELTGRENLQILGRLHHLPRALAKQRADELLTEFGLDDAADRPAKTYSGGMQRRLDLAASLVARPSVLFLDEPTTGLDPRSRIAMWEVIRGLVRGGTTLLLTTQYLDEADALADTIVVIDHGRVIASGTSEELKTRIGGDVLEFSVPERGRVDAAAQAVAELGTHAPKVEADTGLVSLPVGGEGSKLLVTAVRRLDAAGIEPQDMSLRRPSLDDVFLSLTGHPAEAVEDGETGETAETGEPGERTRSEVAR